jgi:hypothetical protein
MPRSLMVRKFLITPIADVIEDGQIIGEMGGDTSLAVYRGSRLFPKDIATFFEDEAQKPEIQKKLEEMATL